ncbi:MAG: ADP-ribosylglycohydrolase family protein [Cypionkella sp.]
MGQIELFNRAMGALVGVAIGDALGMPTQTLTREAIVAAYGRISGFVAPYPDHPVSHGLLAAQITDDTEQTLLLARQLIEGQGKVDANAWAQALLAWEADVKARGSRDLLGPSSKAALEALMAGVPATQTGRNGTTNGAAMRIVPVGIATPPVLDLMLVRVEAACQVTHATGEAIAAAAAVAMVVSQGLAGASFEAAIPIALQAARAANRLGAAVGERDMAGRIALALKIAATADEAELARQIGTSVASRSSVAAAFGVVRLAAGDPWAAALIAANIGDDTDTIGAIATGMAGACAGLDAFPKDRVEQVMAANILNLKPVVTGLLALRAMPQVGRGAS